jgi:hypothetical protein
MLGLLLKHGQAKKLERFQKILIYYLVYLKEAREKHVMAHGFQALHQSSVA